MTLLTELSEVPVLLLFVTCPIRYANKELAATTTKEIPKESFPVNTGWGKQGFVAAHVFVSVFKRARG